MKRNSKYFVILVIGFALWIAETAYFGFNDKPESGLEGFLDVVTALMMIYGVVGDITTNLRIHKTYHNITNIKTNKVHFQDEPKIMSYNVGMKNSNVKIK